MDGVSRLVHILRKKNQDFSVKYVTSDNGKWIAETTVNDEHFSTAEFTSKKECKHELARIVIARFNFDESTNSERKDNFRSGKYKFTLEVEDYECRVTNQLGETFTCRFSNLQTEIIKHTIKD